MAEDAENRRALIIAAHPDDGEFGAAGTIARWASEGWEFYYLLCTNGAKGTSDPNMPPEKLVRQREQEQRKAAETLGARDVYFLGYEDGELVYTRELLGRVVRVVRTVRPRAIFTHDPESLIHPFGRDDLGVVRHGEGPDLAERLDLLPVDQNDAVGEWRPAKAINQSAADERRQSK